MKTSNRSKWTQPGFVTAAVILAVAAIGLNAAVSALQLHFKKLPVAMTRELNTLPPRMGKWVQVSKDVPLEKDVQDALATDHNVFRDYVDSTRVSKQVLDEFEGKTEKERQQLLLRLQYHDPAAVINMAVTYYTGLVDTVAHIPDRCYIADGFQPSEYETRLWDVGPNHLGKAQGKDPRIEVRFINFEDQTAAGRVQRRVAYFFFTDGQYQSDPLRVRQTLQNLRYTHGFYSKIELLSVVLDHDKCEAVMKDFLTSSLPEVEKCMPDWNRVEYGPASKSQ